MIEREQLEQARKMLLMAGKDMKALHSLLQPEAADDEIFGFHAQQAAEKALKAWIIGVGGCYSNTHDLHVLLLTLRELGCDISRYRNLTELNVYAVWFRYEPIEEISPAIDRHSMLNRVQTIYDQVQSILDTLKHYTSD